MNLDELFDIAAERHASDVHLATGATPRLRIGGDLVPLEEGVDLSSLLEPLLTLEGRARLGAGLPLERTLVRGGFAYHGIVFRTGEDGLAATFRILPRDVPAFERIMEGAEAFFAEIASRRAGLVLVSGPVGSGKTTTALALMDRINAERAARILVVSQGGSHVFENRRGLVTHLRIGQECDTYGRALEIADRADVDVIATDDLPTLDTLRQALSLGEMGRLVIANLPAPTAAEALEGLIRSAGEDAPALRRSLAENLVAATGQRLVPRATGGGKMPVYEWIANSSEIRAALLDGRDLAPVQRTDSDCMTLAKMSRDLYMAGKLSLEAAFALRDPKDEAAIFGRD